MLPLRAGCTVQSGGPRACRLSDPQEIKRPGAGLFNKPKSPELVTSCSHLVQDARQSGGPRACRLSDPQEIKRPGERLFNKTKFSWSRDLMFPLRAGHGAKRRSKGLAGFLLRRRS